MKKSIIYTVILLSVFVFPLTSHAVSTSQAKEPVDISAESSLILTYSDCENLNENVCVKLYFVATVSPDFVFTLTESFEDTGLVINGISSNSEWSVVRTTLESYITANKILPVGEHMLDGSGCVKFESLIPGLYFVMPVSFGSGEKYTYFDSVIVSVPNLDENGELVYNVEVTPKHSSEIFTGEKIEYNVTKLWRDMESSNRPDSVEVDILCNGQIAFTVTLSSKNNWTYSWEAEDNGDVWTVFEKNVPTGYIATVEKHGLSFSIINTVPGSTVSPPTGDSANIYLYLLVTCFVGFILIIFGIFAEKKAYEK